MNPVASYFKKMAWGIRCVGLLETAFISVAKLADFALSPFTNSEWFWHFKERRFDNRMGIETVAMVPVEQMDIDNPSKTGAERYEPTPFLEFGYVTSRLPIDYAHYSFVDLGSGKGRVLMMALHFPFRRILGIEFSLELHKISEKNLAGYCDRTNEERDCRSIFADATNFEFPKEPSVLYLFNPFKAEAIERVVENIRQSYERLPRHLIVIYNNPIHRKLLDESGFLTCTRSELSSYWLVYETY